MNQYFFYGLDVFLWSLTRASSQEQQQHSYREHGLCWSWTGGRCPVLHLRNYKGERKEKDPQSFCIIQCGVRCWLRCYVSWDMGITDPLHIFAFSYNVYVYLHTIIIIIINNIIIRLFEDLNFCRPTFLVFYQNVVFHLLIKLYMQVYNWNVVKHVIYPKISCFMYSVSWYNYICLAAAMFSGPAVKIY